MNGTTMEIKGSAITLEMMRRYVATYMTDYPFMVDRLEVQVRDMFEKMGKELVAFTDCPREHLKTVSDTATFRAPKTWFQHFKAAYFPAWLLRRFPIQWHEEKQHVIVNVGAVYPQFPEAYPRNLGEIRFSYYKNSPISTYPRIVNDGEYED